MKKFSIVDSIEVRSPCSQDWDTMRGSDQIRFCDHCAKDVHNLSAVKRKDVRRLLARSQGNICVRYVRRPDGRIETLKQKLHQITRQTGIAAGVLGTSLTVSSLAYAQNEPNVPQQNLPAAELAVKENSASGGTVSGVVFDQHGAVITFALVTIFNETGSFYQSVPTSAEGYYEFTNVPEGKYKLKIDASGFDSKEFTDVSVEAAGRARYDAQLSLFQFQEKVEINGNATDAAMTVIVGDIVCTDDYKEFTKNKLILAVHTVNIEEVKVLIGMGKKVNVKNTYDEGNFPLHYAVENGNIEIVQLLLNAGAKISVKNYEKRTPLMMLDYDASTDLVNILLRYGAAVGAVDKNKNTPLILAAGSASEEVVRVLILNGADVNACNKKGETALIQAAAQANLGNVKALLEAGADVNFRSKEGQTAWNVASDDIRQLLVSYGAVAEMP